MTGEILFWTHAYCRVYKHSDSIRSPISSWYSVRILLAGFWNVRLGFWVRALVKSQIFWHFIFQVFGKTSYSLDQSIKNGHGRFIEHYCPAYKDATSSSHLYFLPSFKVRHPFDLSNIPLTLPWILQKWERLRITPCFCEYFSRLNYMKSPSSSSYRRTTIFFPLDVTIVNLS